MITNRHHEKQDANMESVANLLLKRELNKAEREIGSMLDVRDAGREFSSAFLKRRLPRKKEKSH